MDDGEEWGGDELKESPWLSRLKVLSEKINGYAVAEMLAFKRSPVRTLVVVFLGGLAMGAGMALGLTVFSGIAIILVQEIIELELPLIGEVLAEVVEVTEEHLH